MRCCWSAFRDSQGFTKPLKHIPREPCPSFQDGFARLWERLWTPSLMSRGSFPVLFLFLVIVVVCEQSTAFRVREESKHTATVEVSGIEQVFVLCTHEIHIAQTSSYLSTEGRWQTHTHTLTHAHAGLSTKTRVCAPPAWTLIRLANHGTHIHHEDLSRRDLATDTFSRSTPVWLQFDCLRRNPSTPYFQFQSLNVL